MLKSGDCGWWVNFKPTYFYLHYLKVAKPFSLNKTIISFLFTFIKREKIIFIYAYAVTTKTWVAL